MVRVFLFDNGSLRPESVLNLRRIAQRLQALSGRPVEGVSLLHSDRIEASQLNGQPCLLLEKALRNAATSGDEGAMLLPFFIGDSRALSEYVPEILQRLKADFPQFEVQMAKPLFDSRQDDFLLSEMLASRVGECLNVPGFEFPSVVLVDHGTPEPKVNYARNFLAGQLSILLKGKVRRVAAASMESREGDPYRFNEPLLASILNQEPWNCGAVIVSMLFLSPGRHAGQGGDIAQILDRAAKGNPRLRVLKTELLGDHPRMVSLLHKRMQESFFQRASKGIYPLANCQAGERS